MTTLQSTAHLVPGGVAGTRLSTWLRGLHGSIIVKRLRAGTASDARRMHNRPMPESSRSMNSRDEERCTSALMDTIARRHGIGLSAVKAAATDRVW